MTTTKPYRLTIFAADARTVIRETRHETNAKALRSRDDYERRHGRHCHAITRDGEQPAASHWRQ